MRPPCGTTGGYGAHLYRGEETCPACRAARATWHRTLRVRGGNVTHGASGYTNYGCRCDTCRAIQGRWTFHPTWEAAVLEVQRFYATIPLGVPS